MLYDNLGGRRSGDDSLLGPTDRPTDGRTDERTEGRTGRRAAVRCATVRSLIDNDDDDDGDGGVMAEAAVGGHVEATN